MQVIDKIKRGLMLFIIIFIIIPVLFISSVILIDSFKNPDSIPSFFGWKPFIVLSDSMEPTIKTGDLIIIRENKEVHQGDVIAFLKNNVIVTHRIVSKVVKEGQEDYFITKGDHNTKNDDWKVFYNEVEGVYQIKIPEIGKVILFFQTTKGMVIGLSVPILLLLWIKHQEFKEYQKALLLQKK